MRRYRSEDNERWVGFVHRPGDIVVSTRSRSGTTWMQMICALLVFQEPELPAPLAEISPWLDWDAEPLDAVRARLDAQANRRIIKTHTPLDGLPLDEGVTYVVVARHPLDVAVSLYHHSANIDRGRMEELTGRSDPGPPTMSLDAWMQRWIDAEEEPERHLDALRGVVHHAADAWSRRHRPNIVLVHYRDLTDDLAGQMTMLARRLGIDVRGDRMPVLIQAAGLDAMRAGGRSTLPENLGVLRNANAFFRSGRSGEGRDLLDHDALDRYGAAVSQLGPPDLLAWLHR